MWDRATESERQAHAIGTAWLRALARVEFLARLAREALWAFASELNRAYLNALGTVETRVGLAQERHLACQIAELEMRVEDGVVRAVHERDLAELVAHNELGLVERMRQELAGFGTSANVTTTNASLL